jgi:hypothetical protein
VKNKAGLAAYEVGVSAVSIFAQYEMTKHGHRMLAWLGQGINVGSSATPSRTITGWIPRRRRDSGSLFKPVKVDGRAG